MFYRPVGHKYACIVLGRWELTATAPRSGYSTRHRLAFAQARKRACGSCPALPDRASPAASPSSTAPGPRASIPGSRFASPAPSAPSLCPPRAAQSTPARSARRRLCTWGRGEGERQRQTHGDRHMPRVLGSYLVPRVAPRGAKGEPLLSTWPCSRGEYWRDTQDLASRSKVARKTISQA